MLGALVYFLICEVCFEGDENAPDYGADQ